MGNSDPTSEKPCSLCKFTKYFEMSINGLRNQKKLRECEKYIVDNVDDIDDASLASYNAIRPPLLTSVISGTGLYFLSHRFLTKRNIGLLVKKPWLTQFFAIIRKA